MNTRNTWWMVATAAALLVFIVLTERDRGHVREAGEAAPLFTGLVPSQVTTIEVASPRETLKVERNGMTWRMTSPVQYPAESAVIEAFLNSCTRLGSTTTIEPEDIASQPRGLADYGLQPPAATVVVRQGATAFTLKLGTNAPLGQSLYVQKGEEAAVRVMDAALIERFPRTVDEWRERSLLHMDGLAFNRLEVRMGTRGFALERDSASQVWQMTKPPPVKRADNQKITLLIRELQNWGVQQFVSDDPAAAPANFGLQPPVAEMVLGQGTNDLVTVQFGGSPSNAPQFVFARRMAHTNTVLVPRDRLDALTRQFSFFRDHTLLTFNASNATHIEMKGLFEFHVQRQTNGAWRVEPPFNFPADPGLVNELLQRLQSLEIAEFEKDVVTETDLATYGLTQPQLRITISAPPTNAVPGVTNTLLADLLIGTNRQNTALYARRADEASVYVVPLGDIQRIPQNPFALRDRRIWSFGSTNVISVTASFAGMKRRLLRDISGEWQFAPGSQGTFEPVAVEEMIHRMGSLSAVTWAARGESQLPRFGMAANAGTWLEIEIRNGDGTRTNRVDFGRLSASRRPYAATVVDGEPMVFEFDAGMYENLIQFVFPKQP